MAEFRTMPDGSIVFPARGNPPMEVPGYEPTSDPYVFKPILVPCRWREIKDVQLPGCKRVRQFPCCMKKQIFNVTPEACRTCTEPDK